MKIRILISVLAIVFLVSFVLGTQFLIKNGIISLQNENHIEQSEIINFVAAGDSDVNFYSQRVYSGMNSVKPELVLFAGDYLYGQVMADEWLSFIEFLGYEKMYAAIGNHEVPPLKQEGESEKIIAALGQEREFFSFTYSNVHGLVLASDSDYSINSEQYKFIESDLKDASQDSEIDWIIVILHKPLYTGYDKRLVMDFRDIFQPMFDKYNVDLVIQGHTHYYERSKPLMYNHTNTDDAVSSYVNPDGQIYVTVGTGGNSVQLGRISSYELPEHFVASNDFNYGFLNIKLLDNGNILSAKFIPVMGPLYFEGKELDSFHICLREMEYSCTDLTNIDLSGKDLHGEFLVGADLSEKDLSGTILAGANLVDANLSGQNLSDKDLSGTILMDANLANATLSGVDLSGMDLTGVNLHNVDLSGHDLSGTILNGAYLIGVDFSNVDLSETDMESAIFGFVKLSNTNLKGANLLGAYLEQVDMSNLDLSGINGQHLVIHSSNFQNSIFTNAVFNNAIVDGGNFLNADFTGANIRGTVFNDSVFINANLSYLELEGTIFQQSKMSKVNLSGANLNGARFENVTLPGAILDCDIIIDPMHYVFCI